MKTENLTGPLLDAWAAQSRGWKVAGVVPLGVLVNWGSREGGAPEGVGSSEAWSPSTNWSHGGPLFEEEGIDVDSNPARAAHVKYRAIADGKHKVRGLSVRVAAYGPTELIARTRCVVACEFGDTVPDGIQEKNFTAAAEGKS